MLQPRLYGQRIAQLGRLLLLVQLGLCHGFMAGLATRPLTAPSSTILFDSNASKFGMVQRIDSGKSLVLGAIVGSLAQSPLSFVHDVVVLHSLAQWEYDSDAAAVAAGLFAIVYRYCIRQDENPQLNQGVIGAFCLIRTLSRVQIPTYCTALPLQCPSAPLGLLDASIVQQLVLSGAESVLLFGCTAWALDKAMEKGYISKFPN